MGRDQDLAKALKDYVCVEINRPNDMNFSEFRYDFDLTTSIVLANADGTVYHRYGGRDARSAMQMQTLVQLAISTLDDHKEYMKKPSPAKAPAKMTMTQTLPGLKEMGKIEQCNHCHYIAQAEILLARKKGQWNSASFWVYPEVERLGMSIDQNEEMAVSEVQADSAAAKAGLQEGDTVTHAGGKRVRTLYDMQFILHSLPHTKCKLPVKYLRSGAETETTIELDAGWKITDPNEYEWRTKNGFTKHMRVYIPTPGIMGQPLSPEELEEAKLDKDIFALQVERLLEAPYSAGIRIGDVITQVAYEGKIVKFKDATEFYKLFDDARLRKKSVKVYVDRYGKELIFKLEAAKHLDCEPNFAPDPPFGINFGQTKGGVVITYVYPDSNAEKLGLQKGDVIKNYGGAKITQFKTLMKAISLTQPKQKVRVQIDRAGAPLEVELIMDDQNTSAGSQ